MLAEPHRVNRVPQASPSLNRDRLGAKSAHPGYSKIAGEARTAWLADGTRTGEGLTTLQHVSLAGLGARPTSRAALHVVCAYLGHLSGPAALAELAPLDFSPTPQSSMAAFHVTRAARPKRAVRSAASASQGGMPTIKHPAAAFALWVTFRRPPKVLSVRDAVKARAPIETVRRSAANAPRAR
jgi:hypothetical protein